MRAMNSATSRSEDRATDADWPRASSTAPPGRLVGSSVRSAPLAGELRSFIISLASCVLDRSILSVSVIGGHLPNSGQRARRVQPPAPQRSPRSKRTIKVNFLLLLLMPAAIALNPVVGRALTGGIRARPAYSRSLAGGGNARCHRHEVGRRRSLGCCRHERLGRLHGRHETGEGARSSFALQCDELRAQLRSHRLPALKPYGPVSPSSNPCTDVDLSAGADCERRSQSFLQ